MAISKLKQVLVIGGGIGGMCAAIQLRKSGVSVDLVEIDPHWSVYGAGLTLSGATLRAFKTIGVLDQIIAQQACCNETVICDAQGKQLMRLEAHVPAPGVPELGGILRPVLGRILGDACIAAGVAVRLGASFETMQSLDDGVSDGVRVSFTDGTTSDYDLVVGADGMYSKVRAAIFPDAPKPKFVGQGIWRAIAPRLDINMHRLYLGTQCKVGLTPISADEIYLFCAENRINNDHVSEDAWPAMLKNLLAEFGESVARVRDGIDDDSKILYRPLQSLLVPEPWYRGRIVLMGDAVHATTPHLIQGAGLAVEDAIVLAEELEAASTLEEGLNRYVERRYARCAMVVNNSLRLSEIELTHGSQKEYMTLMDDSFRRIAELI